MIAIINDFDAKLFELNGIKYVRNFLAIKVGDTVRVSNAYDTRFTLVIGHYTEFSINGITHVNSASLVSALSPILFVKDELLMSGGGEAINTTVVSFSEIAGQWAKDPNNPITTNTITLDVTGAKSGAVCMAYYKGNVLDKSKILNGLIVSFNGVNVLNELCFVFITYDIQNSVFLVNIQNGFTGDLPASNAPAKMTITDVSDVVGADITPPATMAITDIT